MRRWRDTVKVRRSAPLVALLLGAVMGCEPVPVSGNPLQPVALNQAPDPPHAPAPALPPDPDAFDFEGEDRGEGGAELAGEHDPLALQAKLLGVDPDTLSEAEPAPPAPVAAVEPEPELTPEPEPEPREVPVWDPADPLVPTGFGVRALATLTDVQPPRAIIGLPDGSEQVVQAGTLLPEQSLVVMAIGRDVVQLARVVPEGYYARIDTQTLQTLFPSSQRGAPGR